jgi:hypothetical protein
MVELDFWGNEIVPEEPKPKSKRKKKDRFDWKAFWAANDMDDWFRSNMPESLEDCSDLFKAMKRRQPVGKYAASTHITGTYKTFLIVKGPASQFIIVSEKAKRYFKKRVRRREEHFKILASQFEARDAYRSKMSGSHPHTLQ